MYNFLISQWSAEIINKEGINIKSYLISYDLNSPGQKYQKISDTIESWNVSRIKPLESVWLVRTSMSAEQMRDSLKTSALDSNDLIFITEMGPDRSGWLYNESWDFINTEIL